MQKKFLEDKRGQLALQAIVGMVVMVVVGFIILSLLSNIQTTFFASTGNTPPFTGNTILIGAALLLLGLLITSVKLLGIF